MPRRRRRASPNAAGPAARPVVFVGGVSVVATGIRHRLHRPHGGCCTARRSSSRAASEVGRVQGQPFFKRHRPAAVAAHGGVVTNQRSHLVIGVRHRAVWVGRRELPHLRRHVRHHAQRRVGGCDRGAQRHTRCVVVIPIARGKVTVSGVDAGVGRGVAWVLPGPHPDPIAIRITKVVHKHIAGDLVLHRVVLRHGAAVTGAGRAISHQEEAVCRFHPALVGTELLDAVAVGVVHRGRAQGGAVGIEGDVIAAVTGHGNVHAVHTIGEQHLACVVHAVGAVGVHIEAEVA